MEGFLESFIYLLITVVILVVSMRKKKPVHPVPEEETLPGDPFSDLFRDEEEVDYLPETRPAAAMEAEVEPVPQSVRWMSESEAQDLVMDADAVIKAATENNPIAQLEGQVEEDFYSLESEVDEGIPFDLKKAVIYSEILEKRTF